MLGACSRVGKHARPAFLLEQVGMTVNVQRVFAFGCFVRLTHPRTRVAIDGCMD